MKFYFTKSRSVQQLRALSKKLGKMVDDGSFFQLTGEKQLELRKRLARLYREVRAAFSATRVKRILASSAVLIGLAVSVQAQAFKSPVALGAGLNTGEVPIIHFADIDGDGDQDAFISDYGDSTRVFTYQENTGTAQAAAFGPVVENPFNLPGNNNAFQLSTIDLADVDNDGDLDLFIGTYDFDVDTPAPIRGWENTGTSTSPSFSFSPATNPFNFQPSANLAELVFVDLDGDGDEDVVLNDYQDNNDYEQFRYQENLGIMGSFPQYKDHEVNPFDLVNENVETYVMSFEDLDADGDQDLLISGVEYDNGASFHYYENIGTATSPSFATSVSNPFGLQVPENTEILVSEMVDIDGDADVDIVATVYNGDTYETEILFYENLGYAVNTEEVSAIDKVSVFPTVTSQVVNWDFQMSETLDNGILRVVDVHGRVLQSENINLLAGSNNGTIAVDDFADGMYLLNLTDEAGNNLVSRRFFVK